MFTKIIGLLILLSVSAFASNVPQAADVVQACLTAQGNAVTVPGSLQSGSGASGVPSYKTLTAANNGTNTFVPFFDSSTFSATAFSTDATHKFYVACTCVMSGTAANSLNWQLGVSTGAPALGSSAPTTPLYQSAQANVTVFSLPPNTITTANPIWCSSLPIVVPISSYFYVNDQSGFSGHTFFAVGRYQ